MERLDHDLDYRWHRALNAFHEGRKTGEWAHWMYEAKAAADEVARLVLLFGMERRGDLPKVHHQCSHDIQGQPVTDNHLTCALGTECRNCVFLLALDTMTGAPEDIDTAKAWTCVTHILSESGKQGLMLDTSEGFLQTVDDQMYWRNVYESMSAQDPDEEEIESERLRAIQSRFGGLCPRCGTPLHVGGGFFAYNRTCRKCHYHDSGAIDGE